MLENIPSTGITFPPAVAPDLLEVIAAVVAPVAVALVGDDVVVEAVIGLPEVAAELAVVEPLDPVAGLEAGATYYMFFSFGLLKQQR